MQRILAAETPKNIGKKVLLAGWVYNRRDHGKLVFVDLRDRSGLVQVVGSKELGELGSEDVVEISGSVQKRPKEMVNPKIPTGGVEVRISEIKVLSKSSQPLPIHIDEIEEKASLDKRMDWRWIDLRRPANRLIFEVWTAMEHAFRQYWIDNNYIEIHSPKLMGAASEAGSELFEVNYFDRKAYLAQSPQFYKQMAMAAGFERVFEVGPVFRANPSFTSRHDTEFTGYDAEISFIESHQDVMEELQKGIAYALAAVKEKFGSEIEKTYGRKLVVPKVPFPQVTMKQAKDILVKAGVKSERKGDLSPEEERELSDYILEKEGHEFVFVTEYPIEVRPFYHMRRGDEPTLTKSFDLLWNGLEITTGAQREHRYDVLVSQAKEKGLKLPPIQFYLDFFKYGCPPHGGFGLGPSRMLMKVLGVENVREVTYLYRGVNRLTP
uniref:Aspartate--tRNA ligase n=1 Tax=candidate division WWE3 bacterium TaxID=2053526 RepID=A0A832E0Y2_UNCKA